MNIYELIKDNNDTLFKMRKAGLKNIDTATDYLTVYQIYLGFDNIKSIMDRYQATAEKSKMSIDSVKKIISILNKKV